MSKELITVVTVCFNAGQTIAKTMQSVLNQTYRPVGVYIGRWKING